MEHHLVWNLVNANFKIALDFIIWYLNRSDLIFLPANLLLLFTCRFQISPTYRTGDLATDTHCPWNRSSGSVSISVRALVSFTGFIIPSQPSLGPLRPDHGPGPHFGSSQSCQSMLQQPHRSMGLQPFPRPASWMGFYLHHSFVSCLLSFCFRQEPTAGLWTWCTTRHPRGCQCTLLSPPMLCLPCSIPDASHLFSAGTAHAGVTLSTQLIPARGTAWLLWFPENHQEGQKDRSRS